MIGTLPMTRPQRPAFRPLAGLRTGTAMAAALMLGGIAAPALADGFNGTITSSTNVFQNTATDFSVNGPEAIIDWEALAISATDTNIDFLPVGQTVTFQNNINLFQGDFTVLNRISPTFNRVAIPATISLSGTVNSSVNTGNASIQGGNIWFYSPYGIIANSTSVFNVGGLLLTTSDIQLNGNGGLYLSQGAGGNQIGFQQATQPGSFVRIMPGAQINAANASLADTYVGIFAPRIEQGGTIRSNGMTALAAGESGSITFNAGLISIAIDVGTADPNGVVHTGNTGGPASVTGESKTIAMVAMSKNAALTMLLGGSIGYDAAAAGIPDGGAVELYAGRSLQTDAIPPDPSRLVVSGPANASAGTIAVGNATFTSQLDALATDAINVAPIYNGVAAPGLVDFRQTARLVAGNSIALTAEAGERIRAGDSLFLAPMLRRTGQDVTISVSGDSTGVITTPGQIDVANFFAISADGAPDFSAFPTSATGADGQGGDIIVSVSAGSLSAGQGFSMSADGIGSDGLQTGGNGTGGTIDIGVSGGGTISGPGIFVTARGSGGNAFGTAGPAAGGDAFGGTFALHDDGGSLDFDDVFAFADARGGSGSDHAGSATGGRAAVRILGTAQNWNSLSLGATSAAGDLQQTTTTVGDSTGLAGAVLLSIGGTGALTVGNVDLDASAFINPGSTLAHSVQAGDADVRVGAGGSLIVTGALAVFANAGLTPDSAIGNVVVAPAMTAGRASVTADGGSVTAGFLNIAANATGVAADTTGALAQGGSTVLGAINGGSLSVTGSAVTQVRAEAYGAVGPAAANALGGTARVYADNGTITAPGGLAVSASALAGGINFGFSGTGTGFAATGNAASVELLGGGGAITVGTLVVYAKGEASLANAPDGAADLLGFGVNDITGIGGDGGTGTGGTAQVIVAAGTLGATDIAVRANGIGGGSDASTALAAFTSGNGQGGTALFTQTGGTVSTATLDVRASGFGGSFEGFGNPSATSSNGGSASGGTARASLGGGTLTLTSAFSITANALGGAGMNAGSGGNGGNGGAASNAPGLAELLMPLGSTGTLTAPSLTLDGTATGGAGGTAGAGTMGNGGAATSGTARVSLADGAISVPGAVILTADALGGTGATVGTGTGGTAAFALTDSLAAPAITRSLGSLLLTANGAGATGTAGTTRFTAQAGRAASALGIAGDFSAQANGTIAPAGDGFTGNFGAVPVTVAGNAVIDTVRDINATTLAGGGLAVTGTLDIIGRAITVSGPGVLGAGGNVQVLAQTSINLGGLSSGGTTLLSAQDPTSLLYSPITVTGLSSTGAVTMRSSAFNAISPGALTFAPSFATTGGFGVQAAGDLTAGTVTAAGTLSLVSTIGALTLTGAQTGNAIVLGAGGAIGANAPLVTATTLNATAGGAFTTTNPITVPGATSIDAAGGITIASLSSGAATLLRSTGGAISVPQLLSAGPVTLLGRSATVGSTGTLNFASAGTTAGDLQIVTAGNLALSTVNSAGATTLTSSTGTLGVTSLTSTGPVSASGTTVVIASPGSLTFAPSAATAGNFTAIAVGDLTFGTVTAPGSLAVQAGGFASFTSLARGTTVAVSSADIRVTGQLGQRGVTNQITLTNIAPAAGTAMGGAAATSGWSLDAAEALRLFAEQQINVVVPAQAANPADVVIGNLAITYGAGASAVGPGANLGAGGVLSVTTPGRIRVTGAVAPVMSTNSDQVSLTAGQRIDVVTDTGSIVLRNGAGALTGTLLLTAPTARVAAPLALSELDGITALSAATARLAFNDGVVSDLGMLQANALAFTVAPTTLYIQNTGIDTAIPNRRGFTANSLSITGQGGTNPSFAINGVLLNQAGKPVTGLDTYSSIQVNGVAAARGGAFDPASTVNGCVIGIDCTVPTGTIAPPHETIKELVTVLRPGAGGDALLNLPLVQYGETPLLNSPPLIDEPVTGVGNDDLWLRRCGADNVIADRAIADRAIADRDCAQ